MASLVLTTPRICLICSERVQEIAYHLEIHYTIVRKVIAKVAEKKK
jgi:hypothetical protein